MSRHYPGVGEGVMLETHDTFLRLRCVNKRNMRGAVLWNDIVI